MENVDFAEFLASQKINQSIKKSIEDSYKLIDNENGDELRTHLNDLHGELLKFFTENKIKLKDYSFLNSAKFIFSCFLQHLFFFTLKKEIKLSIKKQLLLSILADQDNNFYYSFDLNGKKKVVFWADTVSSDTVLTAVSQRGDKDLLAKILAIIKSTFAEEMRNQLLTEDFESYFLHENKLGRSALSLIWLRKDIEMENILFYFVEPFYGFIHSNSFKKFLFQIDKEGSTALMRAASQKFWRIYQTIIDNLARIFLRKDSDGFLSLLYHKNTYDETILHKIVQTNELTRLEDLLYEISLAFNADRTEIGKIFLLDTKPKTTVLIEAIKLRNKKLIHRAVWFASDRFKDESILAALLNQQDSEGYTPLMHTVESNYYQGFEYFLNLIVTSNWLGSEYETETILKTLRIKNKQGHNVFQLASKLSNWEILEELADMVDLISFGRSGLLLDDLNYVDEQGANVLSKLYREESDFRDSQNSGRTMSTKERKENIRRLKLAKLFANLGQRAPVRDGTLQIWPGLENFPWSDRIINFFSIFCGAPNQRVKRSSDSHCFFSEKDFKPSLPEVLLQRRQEALAKLVCFLTQEELEFINEVYRIRSASAQSKREQKQLDYFRTYALTK